MNTTLRTIRVRGTLAKLLKRRTFKAVVRSPQEAIRFLLANYPELEGYMRPRYFQVTVGNCVVNEETIGLPTGVSEEICITPAICGAGGPVGQIITGIGLITLSIFVPFVAPVLLPLGIGLTLTGVAGLIAPVTVDSPESTDSRDSYNFNGVQQTSREGPPVPLVYGDIVTGSIVLSVNIDEDEEEIGINIPPEYANNPEDYVNTPAYDADAPFSNGTGNPNPDPNPVPDPEPEPGSGFNYVVGIYRVIQTTLGTPTNDGTLQFLVALPFEYPNGDPLNQGIYQLTYDTSNYPGIAEPSSDDYEYPSGISDRRVMITRETYCEDFIRFAGTGSGSIYVVSYTGSGPLPTWGNEVETYQLGVGTLTDRCPENTPATQTNSISYLGEGLFQDWYSGSRLIVSYTPSTFGVARVTDTNGPDKPGP